MASLTISLLLLTVSVFGQKQLLNEYEFDNGEFYLLGTFSESDRNSLQDSTGEFYTDDFSILNKIKKDWRFKKPGKKYSYGYHYTVFFADTDKVLSPFSINLNCKEIVTDQDYFYFSPGLLRQLYGQLKKPHQESHSFKTIEDARQFSTSILDDTCLIMASNPLWTEYEGTFRFTYHCKDGTKDCLDEDRSIFKSIEAGDKGKISK